ncbi:hypothetical protein [Cellulosimicrobium funkei]|uniref:hypothetical protein n=1 Tax=Cellulosimicrobium funkei TaxID=264251 RepID=UPI003429197B
MATAQKPTQTDAPDNSPWVTYPFALAALIGGVAGVCLARDWPTRIGVALTAAAIGLALIIYTRQSVQQMASETRINSHTTEQFKTLAKKADEASDTRGVDPYRAEVGELEDAGLDLGDDLWWFPAGRIPLAVIADLVAGWRAAGKDGRWVMDDIHSAIRRRNRKGNHPWFIHTYDPDEGRFRYWKLGKGGGGIKVVEMDDPAPAPTT